MTESLPETQLTTKKEANYALGWRSAAASPWPELAILFVAALVRFWRLAYHSIWFDEAISLRWARSDAVWIWDQTFPLLQDKHPPAYYLYLHFWNSLFELFALDHNDALLRATGALLGVLTVLGVLLLVRRVSGRQVALFAGLLAAVAPALVWYSQELRMFQPAATLAVWSAYFLIAAWSAGRTWLRILLWLAMVATLVGGVYTYLFSAFLYPAAGLSLLLLVMQGRSKKRLLWYRFAEGVVALLIATALFLPLARNAWLVNDAESVPGAPFDGFAQALWTQVQVFTIWRPGWVGAFETAIVGVAALLLVLGLILPRRNHPDEGLASARAFLWVWLFVPLLVGGAMLATTASVFGEDRYFLFLAPFALWAIARGAMGLAEAENRLARMLGWSLGILVAAAMVAALVPLWSPGHARENWRAAIAHVITEQEALTSLRTAVISHIDYTRHPAEWYLRQRYTFDELPLYFPFGGTLTPDQIESVIAPPLAGVEEAGFDTLWLLQSHLEGMDDGRLVEGWLATRYPVIAEEFPAGIRETAYAIRSRYDELPLGVSANIDAELAPDLRLIACEITTPVIAAGDDFLHPPSGRAHVRLWWQSQDALGEGYRAQVRLVNDDGVWGELLAREGDTLAKMPTSTWTPGEFVRHEVDVNLNPATQAGDYNITVALLNANGDPVTEPATCGNVSVQ